jgi:hypothetical protein
MEKDRKTFSWGPTIGIVVSSLVGIGGLVFGFYKDVIAPKSAPINISVNLQLKKIGPGKSDASDIAKRFIAIEMRVSATNPSTRQVFLLPSAWIAHGLNIGGSPNDVSGDERSGRTAQFRCGILPGATRRPDFVYRRCNREPVPGQGSQAQRDSDANDSFSRAVGKI